MPASGAAAPLQRSAPLLHWQAAAARAWHKGSASYPACPAPPPLQVQALLPSPNTSLQNWWNVYDQFNVWRTYGVGDPMPAIDNATFVQIQVRESKGAALGLCVLCAAGVGVPVAPELAGWLGTLSAAGARSQSP